jgi:pyrroloquinoline quinone biosynthesis protein B
MVASLAVVDLDRDEYYLLDCTPDFREQIAIASKYIGRVNELPKAIFLTHAHIGHYLGLVQLGKEVINSSLLPIYAMPRMKSFIENNAPWEMLVSQKNIDLKSMSADQQVKLSEDLSIIPLIVPHRDEYSETVGFLIKARRESLLYIPDIDKWEKWSTDITELIGQVDYALLDGTFYQDGELPGRNMKDIPHPFVEESMQHFSKLSALDKSKVHFIHLNHTNPLLDKKSKAFKEVYLKGFNVAIEGISFLLD